MRAPKFSLGFALVALSTMLVSEATSAQALPPGIDKAKVVRPRPQATADEPASELHLGNVEIGSLVGRAQYYKLNMPPRAAVQLELRSQAFDGYLEVFSSDGARSLISDDDSGGDFNPRLVIPPQSDAEPLIVVVSRSNPSDESAGRFQLTAAQIVAQDELSPVIVGTQPSTVSSSINPENIRAGLKTAYVRIPVIAPVGSRLMIDVVSDDFDPAVELQRGAVTLRDDDSGDGWNARLIRRLKLDPTVEDSSRYVLTILVRKGAPGPFKATFQLLPEPQAAPRPEPIRVGAPVDGLLTPLNPLIDDARPYVAYRLTGRAGEEFIVSASGKEASNAGAQPRMNLDVGLDTAVGFGVAQSIVGLNGPAKLPVTFRQAGEIIVRVSANLDWVGRYQVQVDRVTTATVVAGER